MDRTAGHPSMPWLDTEHKDYTRWLRSLVGPEVLLSAIAAVCVVLCEQTPGSGDWAILLGCRSDNGKWSIPGGAKQPDESVRAAAVRELREETGLVIEDLDQLNFVTEFSGSENHHRYPDGEVAFTKIVYGFRFPSSLSELAGQLSLGDHENATLALYSLQQLPDNCSDSTLRIVEILQARIAEIALW